MTGANCVCVHEWFNCSLVVSCLYECNEEGLWCNCPRTACPVPVGLLVYFLCCLLACGLLLSLVDYESYPLLTNSRRPYRSIFSVLMRLSVPLLTKIVNVYGPSNKIKRKMKKIFALQPASFLEN